MLHLGSLDRFVIENRLWVISSLVGVSIYDFDFRQYFDCRTPYENPKGISAIARVGAFDDYSEFYKECSDIGIDLVNSPEQHYRCTSLQLWYPLISELTPRSAWFKTIPSFEELESFGLPVFVKGDRQTSKHSAEACIVRNRADYDRVSTIFKSDPILNWQDFVCRELLELRKVSGGVKGKMPASFEFRTFWWRGKLVGDGRYWFESDPYSWTDAERTKALHLAELAVKRLDCPFVVIDLAQTIAGEWVIIECNDGMESGYAGASPFSIWQKILNIESS